MRYIEHGSTYTQGYHLIFLYIYIFIYLLLEFLNCEFDIIIGKILLTWGPNFVDLC
jgi:hypothetical protein